MTINFTFIRPVYVKERERNLRTLAIEVLRTIEEKTSPEPVEIQSNDIAGVSVALKTRLKELEDWDYTEDSPAEIITREKKHFYLFKVRFRDKETTISVIKKTS